MAEYTREDLLELLHNNVCAVSFTKTNGETRLMECTLLEQYLPKIVELDPDAPPKKVRTPNLDVIPVWDLDKEAWRSFRIDSINSVDIVHTDSID